MNEILIYFVNVLFSGFSLGLSSLANLGFLSIYILATQKNVRSALNSVIFVFIGRLAIFTFLGGIFCLYPDFYYYLQTQKIFFYADILLGIFIINIGVMIILLAFKKYKILEFICKYDYLLMFFIGIILGISSNVISRLFFVDLILNYNNYLLGVIFSFFYSLASFFSPLILIVIFLGYLMQKLYNLSEKNINYSFLIISVQKISGILMLYFGILKIVKAFLEIGL
ncbi:MAG: hypothetical protein LBF97_00580 [Elusimicrobiota bacterium]|jgi:hypothetical protein|nr:hypothetical protein [Elusimicrobiota bacterium]